MRFHDLETTLLLMNLSLHINSLSLYYIILHLLLISNIIFRTYHNTLLFHQLMKIFLLIINMVSHPCNLCILPILYYLLLVDYSILYSITHITSYLCNPYLVVYSPVNVNYLSNNLMVSYLLILMHANANSNATQITSNYTPHQNSYHL